MLYTVKYIKKLNKKHLWSTHDCQTVFEHTVHGSFLTNARFEKFQLKKWKQCEIPIEPGDRIFSHLTVLNASEHEITVITDNGLIKIENDVYAIARYIAFAFDKIIRPTMFPEKINARHSKVYINKLSQSCK